ncbi:hypothetical protein [Neisseria meningitidis]|nr:hypothetical protein [Neisseria meningitidis]
MKLYRQKNNNDRGSPHRQPFRIFQSKYSGLTKIRTRRRSRRQYR